MTTRRSSWSCPLATVILFAITVARGSSRAADARIPLCAGLTIVTAVNDALGDYETIKRIASIDAQGVKLTVSTQRRVASSVQNFTILRTVLPDDLKRATLYLHTFHTKAPITIPGSTALGVSSAVLRALKTSGAAELGIVSGGNAALSADQKTHPNVYDFRENYPLKRAETASMPITVNDAKVDLPVVRAVGDYIGDTAEFLFLDDESNPLALQYRFGSSSANGADVDALRLQVVKISYRCETTTAATRIERALAASGRAEVYDIYFDFNSDRIREESSATLKEIGEVMRRHPDWKLAIEGHTDAIGGDASNLDLSQRRAAAVKAALVASQRVAATRLSTTGYGESRPKDTNETLEGRARNRRVELVRQP
jgi:outer membrane protein OmpA-like peptidoglycan-associated protein